MVLVIFANTPYCDAQEGLFIEFCLCAPQQRSRAVPKTTLAMSAPMILEEDTEPMTMDEAIEELFGAVITAMDNEGRIYSYDFRLLPSKQVSVSGSCGL